MGKKSKNPRNKVLSLRVTREEFEMVAATHQDGPLTAHLYALLLAGIAALAAPPSRALPFTAAYTPYRLPLTLRPCASPAPLLSSGEQSKDHQMEVR